MALNKAQLMDVPGGPGVVGAIKAGTNITITADGTISALTGASVLPIANGGTGQTTANAALNALLPSQATHSGQFLTTDGTTTSWATVSTTPVIPAGAIMLFAQAAAPTGWTQVTTATYNDAAIRLVTSTGAGTGGTIAFSTLFSATSTYSGSINITSGNVGNTTLTVGQLASHLHDMGFSPGSTGGAFHGTNQPRSPYDTYATGGNEAHTHTLVGAQANGNFTSNFAVKYVNIIVCSKQ